MHQYEDNNMEGIEEEAMGESEVAATESEQWETACKVMKPSSYSAGGISSPRTLELKGQLNGISNVILIDSGASHNFVLEQLVREQG